MVTGSQATAKILKEDKVKAQTIVLFVGISMLLMGMTSQGRQSASPSQAEKLFARAKPDDYMGNEGCASCHAEKSAAFAGSPHAAHMAASNLSLDHQGCEGCHGPGRIHQAEENAEVISFRKMTPKESSAACLRCHAETMSPSHWKQTEHARADVACVSCHQIHPDSEPDWAPSAVKKGMAKDPRSALYAAKFSPRHLLKADESAVCGQCHPTAVGEFRQANHHPVPEGRMTCSDCHSVHPSKLAKIKKDDVNGKCVTCHVEKAGPFVFEHDPVSEINGNGCVECHRPHGANNAKLLNSVSRGLCAQCHTDKFAQHYPGQTCWNAGCHVAPHGSNSDPHLLKN